MTVSTHERWTVPLARSTGADAGLEEMNLLAEASSSYLRSARQQPVDWMEWGQTAFDRATREDKPILLDIGAVWCHWCHVMDRESYEDPDTARIINQHFVAIKVDRDERPDVDARYQAAVSAISGQGGWPLTAFLTPTGKPYFGGTYFPPEDRHGRPSFGRVLLTMAESFAARRAEVDESAASVMHAIEHNESFTGRAGNPGEELYERMVFAALRAVDMRNGGFGSQPKFPHSSAIDLLIDAASRPSATPVGMQGVGTIPLPEAARRATLVTLDKMARGGMYDQLAGGFHRYSVDEHWIVPHFEKMAYDNSELLRNYTNAYLSFGQPGHAAVARDIIRWMDETLTDRERGGFYASQDADFSLEDDGDYFTWTRDEAAAVLTAEELAVAAVFYDIGEIGDMHHNVAKNVLHVQHTLDIAARKAGVPQQTAAALLESARRKMLAARLERPAPFIDRTIYTGWNAMCISAYLLAGRALDLPDARAFAIKSLDRVLAAWDPRTGLARVLSYGESVGSPEPVPAVLDDLVFLGHAALDGWEATGKMRYFDAAIELMEAAIDGFYDPKEHGFFDTPPAAGDAQPLGALSARRKPLQDSPTPSGNAAAAALLLRLEALSSRADYTVLARQTLEAFAGVVEHFGLYAASYALALQRLLRAPVQVCVIGDDAAAAAMEATAMRGFAVNKSVVRLKRVQLGTQPSDLLPPALQATLPHLPATLEGSFAVVCSGNTCQPPVTSPEALAEILAGIV